MRTFETEKGVEIGLIPVQTSFVGLAVARVEREFRAEGKRIDPPTYTLDAAGKSESHLHVYDLETGHNTLDVPGDPEQTRLNHGMWAEYVAALEELEAARGEEQIKTMLIFGTEFEMPEDLSAWEAKLAYVGREVPEDPNDRKALYMTTELLTDGDLALLIPELYAIAAGRAVSQDDIDLFRGDLERAIQERTRAGLAGVVPALRALGGEPAAPGDEDGEGVGDQA